MTDSKRDTSDTHTRLAAQPDPDDRRSQPRAAVRLPASLSTADLEMDVDLEVDGEVRNVSGGGLFVRSEFLEPPDTEVELRVAFGERWIRVRGRVAWVAEVPPRGPGMGIALDDASRQAWQAAGVPKIA